MAKAHDVSDENILYDLTIHADWPQESETLYRSGKEKVSTSLTGRLTSAASRSTWTFMRSAGLPVRSDSPCSLPPGLLKLINYQIHWHMAVSINGQLVAVLQDQNVEIRCCRDEYSSPIARWSIAKDCYPQWRCLAWNQDSDLLAWSDSTGTVQVFDIVGTELCTLPSGYIPKANVPVDFSSAICSLIFKDAESTKWATELLVINLQGSLRSYFISREGDVMLRHTFSLSSEYSRGVTSVVYSPNHSILIVGGCAEPDQQAAEHVTAEQHGLTAWRILSDLPHYKLVTDYEQDLKAAQRRKGFMKALRNLTWYGWQSEQQDGVYRLSLSPDGTVLAAIHQSGAFSLWDIPSLRMKSIWPQDMQPGYDEVNQAIAENPKKRKTMKEHLQAFFLTDANWWSNEALIFARGTGAVTVCSVNSLENLLGRSPEWFDPAPRLSMSHDGGFLGLECEHKYSSLKRRVRKDSDDEYEDTDDEEEATIVTKSAKYVKQALYYVTDSERFQPPRKKPKLVTKTYRLVCLKSTTPEELYARRIDNEEYGEALELAKAYGLDCDKVYQRQWRKTPVSVASIQDYLSKISKRSWVLHECMQRVPEDMEAMRELLQYGLSGTDLEALICIGKNEDDGRFILCGRDDELDESLDPFDEEGIERAKQSVKQRKDQLLHQVDFSSLTLEQRELCRARMKLLQYIDRLSTYEEILGGTLRAEELFDHMYFEKFRSDNIVELAVDYARACNCEALDIIFRYHGSDTLPHRLAILANFPETFSPDGYSSLLPEPMSRDNEEQKPWREQDWCELNICRNVIDPEPIDLGSFLYDLNPDYLKFRPAALTPDLLRDWYEYRASEIERLSCQVDHALELIKLGMDRNIPGLEQLHDDLVTLGTLVYECHVDISLSDLRQTPDIDKLRLMMSRSSDEMYEKNLQKWLIPFLERCEEMNPGAFITLITEYLVTMAKQDLSRCLPVFERSRADVRDKSQRVISDENQLMSIALECIYACESTDQLTNVYGILECLPQRGFGIVTDLSTKLHNQVDELELHLSAAEILQNNGLPQTIAFLRQTQEDAEAAKQLFTKLTRMAGRKEPALRENQWKELLTDLLILREKAYRCIDVSICYEIFVESLLCSSRPQNIQLAGQMIDRSAAEGREPDYTHHNADWDLTVQKVAYDRALLLVLRAAREYFDSSAVMTDPSMELARLCLGLITDGAEEIAVELDLIESLSVLQGFGVDILPPQVRLCEDKLDMVHKAIQAKPYTYRNLQRLLKLGRLLRVGKDELDREGSILRLVAITALNARDFNMAYETCYRLMDISYAPSWVECESLAEAEEFQDISAKIELLCFAVGHCAPEKIEPILKAKCLLETQVLYEKVHCQLVDRSSQSPTESPFTQRGALQQTKQILSSTNRATRAVFSHVSDKKWWKKTLGSLQPLRHAAPVDESDDLNVAFEKQGFNPFYEDDEESFYLNKSECDYKNYKFRKQDLGSTSFSESVLRTSKLEEALTDGETRNPTTEVLLQLGQDSLALDSTLGLGYLLALPKAEEAERCFERLPRTSISLQLACYYYALQIYNELQPASKPRVKPHYLSPPIQLVQHVLYYVTNGPGKSEEMKHLTGLIEKLQTFTELLIEDTQAQTLRALDRDIDVARFSKDEVYRRETILGLAMCTDRPVYLTALSLARRNHLPDWEVFMAHLEFLFDSGLATDDIEARVQMIDILPTLTAEPDQFRERMKSFVYPTIEGVDHERLIYYYELLSNCQSTDDVTPQNHIKALKKVKSAAKGLNYKKLMDGGSPLDVLMPALTSNNLNTLAKLATKIPDSPGGFLHPSVVYCAWAVKEFWEDGKKRPTSTTEWLQRFDECAEYLQKLQAQDVLQLVDGITFVPQAIEKLTVECRLDIIKRTLKYCRQHTSKKKKRTADNQGTMTWEEVVQRLEHYTVHLQKMKQDSMVALSNSDDPVIKQYAITFDLSKSETLKVQELLKKMVLEGQPAEKVQLLLEAADLKNWTLQTALKEALTAVTDIIRLKEKNVLLSGRDGLAVLQDVVTQVTEHQQRGGTLVSTDDVISLIRPFCSDATVDVSVRLDVLHILEKSFSLSEEDMVLLILYRSQAVISTAWPDKEISEEGVNTDSKRQAMFEDLLQGSSDLQQLLSLGYLLQVWPPLHAIAESSENPEGHPWCQLLKKIVIEFGQEAAHHVVELVKSIELSNPLSEKCLANVSEHLMQHQCSVAAMKCLLTGQHHNLYKTVVQQLSAHTEAADDEELFRLLLKRHLTIELVSTLYYPKLVDYILANQNTEEELPYYLQIDALANQLQDAGHDAEAGTLMLEHQGTLPALRTFDTAIGMLSRWFHR